MGSLVEIRQALEAEVQRNENPQLPCHVAAFGAWIIADDLKLRARAMEATDLDPQMRNPDHVAALGYAAAAGSLSQSEQAILVDEIAHLQGRQFFSANRPMRFEIDGIALLGVALGIMYTSGMEGEAHAWLSSLLPRSCSELIGDPWQLGLVQCARVCLGETHLQPGPADLAAALAAKGLLTVKPDELQEGWQLAIELKPHGSGPGRDAVRLMAFDYVIRLRGQIAIDSITREGMIQLLQGLSRSMRLWTYEGSARTKNSGIARWDIENEYHVQNLLWTVLAPILPDLEDEENLPSVGHKNPRADLCIPSLRTIIEVKFMRKAGQRACAELIGQIGEDASLYLSNSRDYDNIVCFIWDDLAHTEQHAELKAGLESIRGISGAIILPRPGKMARSAKVVSSD